MHQHKEKIAFFLPTRKGSERVISKNTRNFANYHGGILELKLNQLLQIPEIPIIISTNDHRTIKLAESLQSSRIIIIERPEELCLSSTVVEDFINYIPTIVNAEHIFWVHTTSPFVDKEVYENALSKYWKVLDNGFDSLLSVNKIQQFLWDAESNDIINHDRGIEKWPRTQDLKPLYEINHAFYINSRNNYLKLNDRIGKKPFLYELRKLQAFDIDWEDDFKTAELIYEAIRKI